MEKNNFWTLPMAKHVWITIWTQNLNHKFNTDAFCDVYNQFHGTNTTGSFMTEAKLFTS